MKLAPPSRAALLEEIADLRRPLRTSGDLDPLVERVGDARFVLIGEASHGTSEYYAWRARLSRRLIESFRGLPAAGARAGRGQGRPRAARVRRQSVKATAGETSERTPVGVPGATTNDAVTP